MKEMKLDAQALMSISADIKRSLLKSSREGASDADKQQATELLKHLYPSFVNDIPNSFKTQLSSPILSGSTPIDTRKGGKAIEAISAAVVIVSQLSAQNDLRLDSLGREYVAQATVIRQYADIKQKGHLKALFASMLKGMQLTQTEQAARAKEIQTMINGYYDETHESLTHALNKVDLTKLDGGDDYYWEQFPVAINNELLQALSDTRQALAQALGYEDIKPVAVSGIKLDGAEGLGSSSSA